jgi:hypothetical protein
LANELIRPLHHLPIKIWPTVGGKSHHLARIFTPIAPSELHFSLFFALCANMARLLYGIGQVQGPNFGMLE